MREAEHLPAIRRIAAILEAMRAPGSPELGRWSADAAHPPVVPHPLDLVADDDGSRRHDDVLLRLVGGLVAGAETPFWFSHETAAMLHGAWTYRTPQLIHVTREANPHVDEEHEPAVRRHHTPMPTGERAAVRGTPVTSLARTLVDCIRTLPRDGALVACDSLFRLGAEPWEVSRIVSASRGKRGVVQAREVLDLCDPRSGSPGETITRLAAADVGLPRPECQLEVPTARGTFFVDLGWDDVRLAVEFDGDLKYVDDPEAARAAEAARQQALEAAGWTVVRVRWDDLADVEALEHRLRRAYLAARRRALLGLIA